MATYKKHKVDYYIDGVNWDTAGFIHEDDTNPTYELDPTDNFKINKAGINIDNTDDVHLYISSFGGVNSANWNSATPKTGILNRRLNGKTMFIDNLYSRTELSWQIGAYVSDITGTGYPNDGIHTDGYYYELQDNTPNMATYKWEKYKLDYFVSGTLITTNTVTVGGTDRAEYYKLNMFDSFKTTGSAVKRANMVEPFLYVLIDSPSDVSYWNDGNIERNIFFKIGTAVEAWNETTPNKNNLSYNKGSYITNVTSTNKTAYPNDGVHTDGYYYVLKSDPMYINYSGDLYIIERGILNIDDAMYYVAGLYTNDNGVFKKVFEG